MNKEHPSQVDEGLSEKPEEPTTGAPGIYVRRPSYPPPALTPELIEAFSKGGVDEELLRNIQEIQLGQKTIEEARAGLARKKS